MFYILYLILVTDVILSIRHFSFCVSHVFVKFCDMGGDRYLINDSSKDITSLVVAAQIGLSLGFIGLKSVARIVKVTG